MDIISKTAVTLNICGETLDPEKVTRLLEWEPTLSGKTGERITKRNGKTQIAAIGFWQFQYGDGGPDDSVTMAAKIEALLGCLTNELTAWEEIAQACTLELFVGLFLDAWNEEFSLPSALAKKIGNRGIELRFDFYAPVESWPQAPQEAP